MCNASVLSHSLVVGLPRARKSRLLPNVPQRSVGTLHNAYLRARYAGGITPRIDSVKCALHMHKYICRQVRRTSTPLTHCANRILVASCARGSESRASRKRIPFSSSLTSSASDSLQFLFL